MLLFLGNSTSTLGLPHHKKGSSGWLHLAVPKPVKASPQKILPMNQVIISNTNSSQMSNINLFFYQYIFQFRKKETVWNPNEVNWGSTVIYWCSKFIQWKMQLHKHLQTLKYNLIPFDTVEFVSQLSCVVETGRIHALANGHLRHLYIDPRRVFAACQSGV